MDSATVAEAMALADAAANAREAAAHLRQRFAPLRALVLDAHDLRGEAPAARGERRQLFLAASDGHCWSVTTDPARAAGFIVSELAA